MEHSVRFFRLASSVLSRKKLYLKLALYTYIDS